MENYRFTMPFEVRDYECDLQGVVNNSVYQNYLEHTRHEFLKTSGIDFASLAKEKIHLVVVRIEIDYKFPLRSGDKFVVALNVEKASRIRFAFQQDIFLLPDKKPIVKAQIIGTALNERNRPGLYGGIEKIFFPEP